MSTTLSLKDKLNAFRDATQGKVVKMTVNEVTALCESFDAETHSAAVNIILVELGWKEAGTINYHGESAEFEAGQKITHVTDDGEMVAGTIKAVDLPLLEISFADGTEGWEKTTTCF